MEITRSTVLAVIRRAHEYADLAPSEDERLIMLAGIMPKSYLLAHFGASAPDSKRGTELAKVIEQLGERLEETRLYIRANPRDRTRPIATQYDVEKPRVNRSTRNSATYRIFGRDRLLLWYAAANQDFSGSRGEAYGLWLVLRFLRQPNVQKLWRRFVERPAFRIPEDAK